MKRAFRQVDVFSTTAYRGNPVAVVLEAEGLTTHQMQRFANWTNLSETTFVLPPSEPGADYQVRIFTPDAELPFAGHPTLGTCHAWLEFTGRLGMPRIAQQCPAGVIELRSTPAGLAFKAPPLLREGPVDEALTRQVATVLNIRRDEIVAAEWVDNGPGWLAVLLRDAKAVLALRPGRLEQPIGAVGPYPAGAECAFEVRAFFPLQGATLEDPVTGSLNASLGQWLVRSGRAPAPYVVSQGTALGRAGRVHISASEEGSIWVGGGTLTCISGSVEI